jgi:hypothetical protein
MKILVLADNFTPEIAATSFRTHEHARLWIEQGHEVTVVTCAPNWPQGRVFSGYKNRLYQEEWIDGIRVIRVWSYIAANQGFARRTLDYISFMLSATAFCWRYPKFDVILATSPQFFTAVAGWLVSVLRRRPWIFELRDIWPESLRAVGASQGRLIDWLERLELFLYRRANRVVALTNSFKRNLTERGIEPDKIDVVTNGVDLEKIGPSRIAFDARQRLGIDADTFLIGYIGTTGMAHGLVTVLEAARMCQGHPIRFLIMGQGAKRQWLEARADEMRLDNVVFRDSVPHDQIPSYYAALDAALVHLKPDPLFKTVIPSKIFECMAMRTPILMAVEGEAAEIVTAAGCGMCVPSGDADSMAQAAEYLANHPGELAVMTERGRQAAEEQFSRRVKAIEMLDSIEHAIDGRSGQADGGRTTAEPPLRAARRAA